MHRMSSSTNTRENEESESQSSTLTSDTSLLSQFSLFTWSIGIIILSLILFPTLHRDYASGSVEDKLKLPLATIDVVEARKNPDAAAEKLGLAMSEVGFIYLVNIPGFKPDELYQASAWFFGLPLESKMKLAKKDFKKENKNSFRGYFPLIPGGHSYKEVFEIGQFFSSDPLSTPAVKEDGSRPMMRHVLHEGNVWPETEDESQDQKFAECLRYHYQVYRQQAVFMMSLIARSLGFPDAHFDSMFEPNPLSTFRIIHYPSRVNFTDVPDEAKDGDTLITTGEHADTSMLTVLATFRNPGLQIDVNHDGNWIDVPAVNDAMVVNIGALLSRMTGYRYKATYHRVIDSGSDRFSAPFFFEPHFDADVSKTIYGDSITGAGEYKKYGPWMTNRTSMFVEYKTTDFGIID